MLTIQELNIAVKYYAFNLPQRFEELSHPFNQNWDGEIDGQEMQLIGLVDRYRGYVAVEEREIRLARKLVERMLQIY